MLRCDVARVKIVTGEKKLIDSSLTVSVKGKQFEIRVLEENGSMEEVKLTNGARDPGIRDDNSSKCSFGGGGSVVAAVEGFSESGSDADVSESCDVLLNIEKHGGGGRKSDGNWGSNIPVQELVSERISNDFGNVGEWVETRVNYEGDKGKKLICVESAEEDRGLENGIEESPSHVTKLVETDKGVLSVFVETEVEGGTVVAKESSGPAHVNGSLDIGCEGGHEQEEGCEEEAGRVEPVWVRTRVGDFLINGPIKMGLENHPSEDAEVDQSYSDSIESFSGDPIMEDGPGFNPTRVQHMVEKGHKGGKKKKKRSKNQNKNIPNLPYNMLRKLPGALPGMKKGTNKKKGGSEEGSRDGVESASGGVLPQVQDNATTLLEPVVVNNVEFQLEVVLPALANDVEEIIPIMEPISQIGTAVGTENILQSNAVVAPREVYEAENLVNIGVELGINFQGGEGDAIDKMVAMEVRDRTEKEDWENQMGDQ
ncbi:hypothetical protein QL285_043809 [Trifolium repens]|nr:hypothetical protein QL285_043809 [Trifolium repens]